MTLVALGAFCTSAFSRKTWRVFALLAAGGLSGGLEAAEAPPVVAAGKYSRGVCRLRVEAVAQDPQGRNNFTVRLNLRLEFPNGEQGSYIAQLPVGFYLNNEKSPLLGLDAEPGKNLSRVSHVGTTEPNGVVTISDIEVGARRDRLKDVEIELMLVRVTEWDQLKFTGLGLGIGQFLKCGPFEFRTIGEASQFRVNAAANAEFNAEHEAYRKRVPLKFISDGYGINHLVLVDAAGRSPTSAMTSTGTASKGTYSAWRLPITAAATPGSDSDEMVYPVTLSLQMPKRYETERLKFTFPNIPLPR